MQVFDKLLLCDVIKAVAPTDEIYPMHTEHPEMFEKLDIGGFASIVKWDSVCERYDFQ